jgi:DNA polymerase-4
MVEVVGERSAKLIPGVGPRTSERLAGVGIRTVAELASAPDGVLERAFGPRLGGELRGRARGQDDRPVVTEREQKSESRETTFPNDVSDRAALESTLDELADSVARGLVDGGHVGRTVTMKIRLRPFRTHTRSRTIDEHTSDPAVIRAIARRLLAEFTLDAPVRLLGVGVAGLVRSGAGSESGGEPVPAAEALTLDV